MNTNDRSGGGQHQIALYKLSRKMPAGSYIYRRGDEGNSIYLIKSGDVAIRGDHPEYIVSAGAVLGVPSLIGEPHQHSARVLSEEVVIEEYLSDQFTNGPMAEVLLGIAKFYASSHEVVRGGYKGKFYDDLIELLLRDADEDNKNSRGWAPLKKPMTQAVMAERVGMDRSTTNAYLIRWTKSNLVRKTGRGQYDVNIPGLRKELASWRQKWRK